MALPAPTLPRGERGCIARFPCRSTHGAGEAVAAGARAAGRDPAEVDLITSVFVVTGAAGSIVSAITADLASASGGTFHLLDLTPEPDRADPDIVALDPRFKYKLGNTPIQRVRLLLGERDRDVYLKLEGANPGGSIKD